MGYSLIAYDVHSNSVRQHLSKKLERKGMRLQKSVFVVKLSSAEVHELEDWVQTKMEDGDSFLILPCCASCLRNARFAEKDAPISYSVFA